MAIPMQHSTIRVLIVDDDVATRVGLRTIMNAEPDIEVVGESASAEDAYRLVEQIEPDVVLMDVQLPGADGITATERIAGERRAAAAGHRAHDLRVRRLRVSVAPCGRERIPAEAVPGRAPDRGRSRGRERRRAPRAGSHPPPDRTVRGNVARAPRPCGR